MPKYSDAEKPRKLNRWILLGAIAALLVLIAYFLGMIGGGGEHINGRKLRCVVSQDVTVFGDRILYYDGATLFCLSASGNELWNENVGANAAFHAGDRQVVVWTADQLQIIDRAGRSTYNDRLTQNVQFARVGEKYVAIVMGESTSPTLVVRDLDGAQIDSETSAYESLVILDCGFFADGEYLWTTALDVYGAAPETTLNTYNIGKQMNTASVSLGEPITYRVIYSGKYLNVVNTRQLRQYDYRGTLNNDGSALVYGWQMIDGAAAAVGAPHLLFAPTLQTSEAGAITELRLLHGTEDSRYSLPDTCVGAAIHGKRLYAFSADTLYRADMNAQRFTALKLPVDGVVTDYLGMTTSGTALLVCGTAVWAVDVP